MNFLKHMRFHVVALFTIALLVILSYWNLQNTFFQQDEWQAFSIHIFSLNNGIKGIINSIFPVDSLSHFNPLAALFSWFEHFFYYTNFALYAWQSIILHIINVVLLYYFVFSWLKNKKIAFTAALFFGVNSIPYQAVTWVAAANSFEVPFIFILLSLIFFQRFIEEEKNRKISITVSFILLFISLMFHEVGIFLFIFYPIIFLIYKKREEKKSFFILSKALLIVLGVFILIRIPFFFGFKNYMPEATDISHPPFTVFPYRLISISLKSFAGSFFPEKTLISFSDQIVRLAYPQFVGLDNAPNPYVSQLIVFDLVSYAITIFTTVVIFLFIRSIKEKKISDALLWSLIFVPASLLPYAFVLGKAGYSSILSPQYYYISSIGTSIIIAITAYYFMQKFSKYRIGKFFVVIVFSLYIIVHIYTVRVSVERLVKISIPIKMFLTTIQSSHPKLLPEVVFFTRSDTAYYGMPDNEKSLPVEIGFGKMIMIWYQKEENFPACMYENNFLLSLLDEGYKECEGRGFGYFRDYDKLIKTVIANRVPVQNIISYSWNGKTEEFKDITKDVQKKIEKNMQ